MFTSLLSNIWASAFTSSPVSDIDFLLKSIVEYAPARLKVLLFSPVINDLHPGLWYSIVPLLFFDNIYIASFDTVSLFALFETTQ